MADFYMDKDAAVTVPVNVFPLTDDTDFKTRETAVAYNAAGMDLVWNFITTAGVQTQTAITPTTGGNYDWTHVGDGMYNVEIPASGGSGPNNNVAGVGWITGVCTGVLPWRGPTVCLRPSAVNDAMVDGTAQYALASTALSNATWTPERAAFLDAAVSSRSTYSGGDTAGTTTLLARIVGTLAAGTHNPQSGDAFDRLGAPTGASIAADISTRSALTAQQVWEYGTRTITSLDTLLDALMEAVAAVGTAVETLYSHLFDAVVSPPIQMPDTQYEEGLLRVLYQSLMNSEGDLSTLLDERLTVERVVKLDRDLAERLDVAGADVDEASLAAALAPLLPRPEVTVSPTTLDANERSAIALATDAVLSDAHGRGAWGATSVENAVEHLYELGEDRDGDGEPDRNEDGSLRYPISDARVYVTAVSNPGAPIVADFRTGAAGTATPLLLAGTYYFWRLKAGYAFSNPDVEVVTDG